MSIIHGHRNKIKSGTAQRESGGRLPLVQVMFYILIRSQTSQTNV